MRHLESFCKWPLLLPEVGEPIITKQREIAGLIEEGKAAAQTAQGRPQLEKALYAEFCEIKFTQALYLLSDLQAEVLKKWTSAQVLEAQQKALATMLSSKIG